MKGKVFLGTCLLIVALPVSAGEPLMLKLAPAMAPAPAFLAVRATVESDRENRAVEVVVESPDYYTSSRIQLDGLNAPRTTLFTFNNLPRGTYEVTATLVGSRGKRAAASGWFRSVSSPGE